MNNIMNTYYNQSYSDIRVKNYVEMSTLYKEKMKRDVKPSLDYRVGHLETIMDQGVKEIGDLNKRIENQDKRIENQDRRIENLDKRIQELKKQLQNR